MSSMVSTQLDGRLVRALAAGRFGEMVALVADGEIGADLSIVGLLASVDPQALDGDGRVDLIRAIERCRAMLDGVQQRALAAVAEATEAAGRPAEETRFEIGAALRLSPSTAGDRTMVALELRDRLGGALAALRAGDISYLQAAHLAEAVRDLPDQEVATVQARVLGRAGDQTLSEFKRTVARAVLAADPASAADRHRTAAAARTIEAMPQPEGMQSFWMTMPASVANDVWTTLTARAKATRALLRAGAGDDPGLDALRVDALVEAILGRDPIVDAPTNSDRQRRLSRCSCGGAQTAAVVLDLPTALGLAENPGEIPGYGPVPAPVARAMAADRDWVRWTTDPGTGQLLDRGAAGYRPSKKLRAFIAARDRVCGFPGCNRRAQQCDCDHVVTYAHHGQTVRVNLGPLCRAHHNAKTHGLWQLTYHPDTATKTWTSPLGKTYTKGTDPVLA